MDSSPLDLPATPERLRELARAGLIDPVALETGLARIGRLPDGPELLRFTRVHLLIIGVLLCALGVVFFFAANWQDMSSWTRMGLLAAGIVGSAGLGAYLGLNELSGRACVLLAALLVGPLQAVYGQTYQTGADAYELFRAWAVVVIPFALVARFGGLWLFWMLLADTALITWWGQSGAYAVGDEPLLGPLLVLLVLFNSACLVGWEYGFRQGIDWMGGRVVQRLAAVPVLLPGSVGMLLIVIGEPDELGSGLVAGLVALLWAAQIVAVLLMYRRRLPDLFMLALACLSCAVLLSTLIGRVLFDALDWEIGGLFFLGAAVLAQVWGIARFLLRVRDEQESAA